MDIGHFFSDFGLFFLKTLTVLVAVIVVLAVGAGMRAARREDPSHHIEVENLNEHYEDLEEELAVEVLDKEELKARRKARKKAEKKKEKEAKKKGEEAVEKPKLYTFHFDGDIEASEVESLRELVTAILLLAGPKDEVMLTLESAGGMVHSYGLAASQLARFKEKKIPLTVVIDQVAASGGYMMAVVAEKIVAAPFAILGSIGVVAELPNFHKLLKENHIEYEQHTAGQFKRTLTVFGENTKKAREKFVEELEETHALFKAHVKAFRPALDLEKVATGEHWYGNQCIDLGLCDVLQTSDDYLLSKRDEFDIFRLKHEKKRTLHDKISELITKCFDNIWLRIVTKSNKATLVKR